MKALILAANQYQFINFCREFDLNPYEHRLVRDWNDMQGWWIDKPVILLEGYELNRNYTLELMNNIGKRFENIGFISEGEMWS